MSKKTNAITAIKNLFLTKYKPKKPFIKTEPANQVFTINTEPPKVVTEDLGKIFERAICCLYNTPFVGKYKYSLEEAEKLKERIQPFLSLFPHPLNHTAKNASPIDFTSTENPEVKLSAKTCKHNDKVCPQVIGQPSKKKFCEYFDLDTNSTLDEIKTYIEENVQTMLYKYFQHTFDQPILYYNQHKDLVLFVKTMTYIDWNDYEVEFSHRLKLKEWNESTTIRIEGVTIGEFQIHNHRDSIKFRWCFENMLNKFNYIYDVKKI